MFTRFLPEPFRRLWLAAKEFKDTVDVVLWIGSSVPALGGLLLLLFEGWQAALTVIASILASAFTFIGITLYRWTKSVSTAQLPLMRQEIEDIQLRLGRVEDRLSRAHTTLANVADDVRNLMSSETHSIGLATLNMLVAADPALSEYHEQTTVDELWLRNQRDKADAYLSYVEESLRGTEWQTNLQSVLIQATTKADDELLNMPPEKRPSHVDPYQLRLHVISMSKYRDTLMFLRHQKSEAEEMQILHLRVLYERALRKRYPLKAVSNPAESR